MAQVPSGWTTSGIDWTSVDTMRNSRTEDIVKELHQAVSERNHWISRSCYSFRRSGTIFPDIVDDARLRVENSIEYIYETLRLWFKPNDSYDLQPNYQGQNIFVLPFNGSVFINFDKTGVTFDEDSFYMGYENIDYSLGGDLESIMGFDVGFLRDYTPSSLPRIDLNDLKKVYDILNHRFYNRSFDVSFSLQNLGGGNYSKTGQEIRFNNGSDSNPNWIFYYAIGSKRGDDIDSLTAKNEFYGDSFSDVSYQTLPLDEGFEVRHDFSSDPYIYSQAFAGLGMKATGFDGLSKNITDIDCKTLLYGNKTEVDQFGGVFPLNEFPDGFYTSENKHENYNHTLKPSLSGNYCRMTEDQVNSGLPTVSGNNLRSYNENERWSFVNFNKEGFLKYYTEATN